MVASQTDANIKRSFAVLGMSQGCSSLLALVSERLPKADGCPPHCLFKKDDKYGSCGTGSSFRNNWGR